MFATSGKIGVEFLVGVSKKVLFATPGEIGIELLVGGFTSPHLLRVKRKEEKEENS